MIRFSSACALSNRSRAAGPTFGWSRIAGNRPFSSHAVKKNVQSMYCAISASSTSSRYRRPMNHGDAMTWSSQSNVNRFFRASAMASSGFSFRPAYF